MSNRSLKLQLYEEDPRCYWCRRETKLTNIPNIKGQPDPLMATIDHVISRLNPQRWVVRKEGEMRKVLACYECNHKRSEQEVNALPKEEIFRRSQGFTLSPKGKPPTIKPLATLEEVLEKFKTEGIELNRSIRV